MKKIIAILFIGIYIFNLVGYQGVFVFFERTISGNIIDQLDKGEYDDAALVEIKVPYPTLYANNWTAYQRYDGEVEMNGVHYNYVKRKLSNDTLYLLCIPNHDQTRLAAAKINYLAGINDTVMPLNGKKSSSDSARKAFNCEHYNLTTNFSSLPPAVLLITDYSAVPCSLYNTYSSAPFQPPRV